MRVCFVNPQALPAYAPHLCSDQPMGGEEIQQAMLARQLVRLGHEVAAIVEDRGQGELTVDGVRLVPAYDPTIGLAGIRFFHPRTSGLWRALQRADADVYAVSCAGSLVGQVGTWARARSKAFVFRVASDTDTDPKRLLVPQVKDRWLYRVGLSCADAVAVQTMRQAQALEHHYGKRSSLVPLLVEDAGAVPARVDRDVDVLWVGNLRAVKRPDRYLDLAQRLPDLRFHMVGGVLPGSHALAQTIRRRLDGTPNILYHGHVADRAQMFSLYRRARILVNTSEVEGFPVTYLEAWMHGVPVVAHFDPDGVIARDGLGAYATDAGALADAVRRLIDDPLQWDRISAHVRQFVRSRHGAAQVAAKFVALFEEAIAAARLRQRRAA